MSQDLRSTTDPSDDSATPPRQEGLMAAGSPRPLWRGLAALQPRQEGRALMRGLHGAIFLPHETAVLLYELAKELGPVELMDRLREAVRPDQVAALDDPEGVMQELLDLVCGKGACP